MCGIAALWGRIDDEVIDRIIDKQRHRGPDGVGKIRHEPTRSLFGHCRLAIIDPAGGRQPLERGPDAVLIANGMIYNDLELRRQLNGAPYRTKTDSESILHLLSEQGVDAVRKVDGMFAFIMRDGEKLIAARDPIGIKPLYKGRIGDALVFASEIKALAGLAEDIEEFPAGHVMDGLGNVRRWYDIPRAGHLDLDVEEQCKALRETLEAAVVKRLRSDVPFGCLLSGGLDSSVIAGLAKRHVPDLQTFAVGLEGSADVLKARIMAEYLDTRHHELIVTPDEVLAALPDILWHLESFDRDLVRSAVPSYFVSKLASEKVKVVLTGEGADELFAGYTYYTGYTDDEALNDELRRSIGSMHNVNLQRVDRMAMAHGLEARVPFLDVAMIELGLGLPAHHKRFNEAGEPVEKWILRKAFEDLMPEEIVWRTKVQFDQGSGLADFLGDEIEKRYGAEVKEKGRSIEESYYRQTMAAAFDHDETVMGLVAHWDDDRVS